MSRARVGGCALRPPVLREEFQPLLAGGLLGDLPALLPLPTSDTFVVAFGQQPGLQEIIEDGYLPGKWSAGPALPDQPIN